MYSPSMFVEGLALTNKPGLSCMVLGESWLVVLFFGDYATRKADPQANQAK